MAIYDSPKVVWIGSSPQALQYGLFLAPKIQCGKILLNYFFRVIPTNWNSIWHIFWHSVWHIFWHSFWHILSGIYSDISSDILSDILCDILHSQLRSRSAHWDLALAVEVRQCPLSSGARGWGPAVVPTELWRSQLRPGSAHSRLRPGSANWALALAVSVPHWDLALAVEGEVGGGRWRKRRRMDEEVGEGGRRHADLIKPRRLTWQARNSRQRFFPTNV